MSELILTLNSVIQCLLYPKTEFFAGKLDSIKKPLQMCFDIKRRQNEEKVKNWKKKYTCTAPPVNIASFEYKIVKNTRKQIEHWDSRANFVPSTVGTWCNNHIVLMVEHTLKISTADLKKCGRTRMAVSNRQRSEY